MLIHIGKLKYQGRHERGFLLPPEKHQYSWDGSIRVKDITIHTVIDIDVYGNKDGTGKQFILQKASLPSIHLVCEDPFDLYTEDNFPFLIGYAVTSAENFRMYVVLDNEPDEYKIYRNGIFFHPLQKIQFLDNRDAVVAEIQENKYTIYDTIPESEINNIKYALALLVGFRHTAQVIDNLEETWAIPWFYRYEYK